MSKIYEARFVTIGGVKQWIRMVGENTHNPPSAVCAWRAGNVRIRAIKVLQFRP